MRKKRPKIRSKKCFYKGKSFPSETERDCYVELLDMQSDGKIGAIETQPVLYFHNNGVDMLSFTKRSVLKYTPDFKAICSETERIIFYEAKGFKTGEFKLRFAVARALHPDCRFVMYYSRKTRKGPKGFVDMT